MNTLNTLVKSLMVGAVALAFTGLAQAGEVTQVITVLKVSGSARYSVDNKTWQPLRNGDVLKQGAVVQTAEDSSVDLATSDSAVAPSATPVSAIYPGKAANIVGGESLIAAFNVGAKPNVLHIFPSTVLSVDKLTKEGNGIDEISETQLDLRAGRILGDVKKLSANSRYEIKTTTGVAGIRGTTYSVSSTGIVTVLTGSLVFTYLDPSTGKTQAVTVNAGYSFNEAVALANPGNPQAAIAAVPAATIKALESLNVYYKTSTDQGTSTSVTNGTTFYLTPQ